MAIKIIPVKCPECGADLTIEEGRKQIFCTYCGTKLFLQNENEHEYIYRSIDEAGIKKAETERIIKMRQLDLTEKKMAYYERSKRRKTILSLLLAVVGILMMSLGYAAGSKSGDPNSVFYMISVLGFFPFIGSFLIWNQSGEEEDVPIDLFGRVKVPASISNYKKKNYRAIKEMLRIAGFTDIRCLPLGDLTLGLLQKPGLVESITINGQEVTSGGDRFPPDSIVIISYHSLDR